MQSDHWPHWPQTPVAAGVVGVVVVVVGGGVVGGQLTGTTQRCSLEEGPGQKAPPPLGAGFVHVLQNRIDFPQKKPFLKMVLVKTYLDLVLVPSWQVTLQSSHGPQVLQPPSTSAKPTFLTK